MTKFNSVTRKIENRKRKEDNTTSADCVSSAAPESSAPPDSLALECTRRIKISKTEENRKKKAKYKLEKGSKRQTVQSCTIPKSKSLYLTTIRRWIWKSQKSNNFTLKQQHFKDHRKKQLYRF